MLRPSPEVKPFAWLGNNNICYMRAAERSGLDAHASAPHELHFHVTIELIRLSEKHDVSQPISKAVLWLTLMVSVATSCFLLMAVVWL